MEGEEESMANSDVTAGELERYLIDRSRWSEAPKEAFDLAESETMEGVPTGISLYKGTYYVIQSSGQGPYILYPESR